MASFDFAGLLIFLQSIFDAFVNFFKKMGFSIPGMEEDEEESAEETTV